MILAVIRNGLAFISLLHFVSGPTQYFTATVHLIRAWYCVGEYVWCGMLGGELSPTCTRVFHFLE